MSFRLFPLDEIRITSLVLIGISVLMVIRAGFSFKSAMLKAAALVEYPGAIVGMRP